MCCVVSVAPPRWGHANCQSEIRAANLSAISSSSCSAVLSRGIQIPIVPGIMPVLSLKQIKRITQLCQSRLPHPLESQLSNVESDPEAVRQVGVEWASAQIEDLLANGVPGIHIYALNIARSAIELIDTARFASR